MVGSGGAGATNENYGHNGSNSCFDTLIAYGGGGGGEAWWGNVGRNGGCGGGSGGQNQGAAVGGSGTNGQGYAGGGSQAASPYENGGGGGAGGTGQTGDNNQSGAGGVGKESDISGTAYKYGGGGGGAATEHGTAAGAGGADGGGAGGASGYYGSDGVPNSGGGGGGGAHYTPFKGGNGGSGIVIVRYLVNSTNYGGTTNNYTAALAISNGITQVSTSGANVFMGNVGIGTNVAAEKLHIAGNVQIDGGIKLGGETRSNWPNVAEGALIASNNLSDVADPAAARDHLGVGSWTTNESSAFLAPSGDGSQLTNITAAQVGALSTNAGALIAANNLSELSASVATARNNLGLGSAATNNANAFLSATGGVVNGNLSVNGNISIDASLGDIPMGVFTNQ